MSTENTPAWGNAVHDFLIRPLTCAPDDFWQQVRRTVHGQPVAQEQIDLIVESLSQGLTLNPGDTLLDLGCGNGALTQYFTRECEAVVGVDYSPALLAVARQYFETPPALCFVQDDALAYTEKEPCPERFTKAFCYGVLQYLPRESVSALLANLFHRFTGISHMVLGNIPNRAQAGLFFGDRAWTPDILDDHATSLGRWYMKSEMMDLARQAGWTAHIRRMPSIFHAVQYRFDVVLCRPGPAKEKP